MMINKDELRRLAEAAVVGKWEFRLGMVRAEPDGEGYVPIAISPDCPRNWRPKRDANMAYIAEASPATILALLDELEAAQRDSERYRTYRQGMVSPEELDRNIDAAMQEQQPCL